MSFRRLFVTIAPLAVGALCLATPRLARAQSITIFQQGSLPRLDASGNQVSKRALSFNPEGVSYNYNYTKSEIITGLPILPVIGLRGEL